MAITITITIWKHCSGPQRGVSWVFIGGDYILANTTTPCREHNNQAVNYEIEQFLLSPTPPSLTLVFVGGCSFFCWSLHFEEIWGKAAAGSEIPVGVMGFPCWADNHRFDHKLIHTFTAGREKIEFDRFFLFLNFNFQTNILGKLEVSMNPADKNISHTFLSSLDIWFNQAFLSFWDCQWIRQLASKLWCWTAVKRIPML